MRGNDQPVLIEPSWILTLPFVPSMSHRFQFAPRARKAASRLFFVLSFLALSTLTQAGPQAGRVIILGFDGADARTSKEMMEAGELPNLSRLAQQGTFSPLGTTTAAESPVAWAALNTGQNPAKTGVPGFVKREFVGDHPQPNLGHQTSTEVITSEANPDGILGILTSMEPKVLAASAGGISFLLFFLVFVALLRLRASVSAILALVLAGIGAAGTYSATDYVPSVVPNVVGNPMDPSVEAMWEAAGRAGKKCVVLDAAMSWDRPEVENVELLSGLGVPDSRGSNGDWFVYTTDEEEIKKAPTGKNTGTAGTVFRVDEREGKISSFVYGPANFWRVEKLEGELAELEERLSDPSLGYKESTALRNQKKEVEAERDKARDERLSLPLMIEKTGDGKAKVSIGGEEQILAEGEWSDFYSLRFEMNPLLKAHAITRVKILSMDEPFFKLFVNILDIDPEHPPFWQPVSQPTQYAGELAKAIGRPFETFGWACITMAYKDELIDPITLLEDIEFTMKWREDLTYHELERGNWDFLFSVFSVTDRVQHMTYHFYDPEHPLYDPTLANQKLTFFGKQITLAEAIPEIYRQMDRIVGKVMDEYVRPEDTLMLCADHGFQTFRRQVHINNWLAEHGYLVMKPGVKKRDSGFLSYVDWTKTRAYALGLGMVYVNLKGREPQGIVNESEVDALLNDMKRDWLATVDPETGAKAVNAVYFIKEVDEGPHIDQEADLMPGFAAGYRVSWNTTMGNIKLVQDADGATRLAPTFQDNDKTWSGGHVSVDPELVRGIFFCNKKVVVPAEGGVHLTHLAPTALRLLGVPVPDAYDREPLEFE